MSFVLLLDFDNTLYPSTLPTVEAVDRRITGYIEHHLNLSHSAADSLRRSLCARFGTTLKGLETLHGVDRNRYLDFIHAVAPSELPPPNPRLRAWFDRLERPTYLFTNARLDWVGRCLASMGMEHLLDVGSETSVLQGILDITALEWTGKPEVEAYAIAEQRVRERHGETRLVFADDRLDNLEAARRRGWTTVWVRPHDAAPGVGKEHHVVEELAGLELSGLHSRMG